MSKGTIAPSTRLYNFDETGRQLGISRARVYELVNAGELRAVRVGRLRRIRESDLQTYVDQLAS